MGVRRALARMTSGAAAALGLAVVALVAPAGASPASAAGSCQVTDATLTWGFKASFRAYIRSSITNGDWTTSGNATYTTPDFIWSSGTGTFDPAASNGEIAFTGGIHFTGHEGLLDSTFSNPRLKFTDANTAVLVLDYTGVSMAEALAGSTTPTTYPGVDFIALALGSGSRGGSGATTTFTSVPTTFTADGYAAFGNYAAGTAMDPLTISITTDASCGAPQAAAQAATGATGTTTTGAKPGIVAAAGLQIPTPGPTPGGPTPAATSRTASVDDPASTRTLEVLASRDSGPGGFGDGFLFGLAGLVIGIVATLLIQFAHLHLLALAKRKTGPVE